MTNSINSDLSPITDELALVVDCGQTKTRAALYQKLSNQQFELNLKAELVTGPGNILQLGEDNFRNLISEITNKLALKTPDQITVLIGVSGAGSASSQTRVKEALRANGFSLDRVKVITDVALLLYSLGRDGIVLICGTGGFCTGKVGEKIARAGGWGYLVGDEGGGFFLGRRALHAVYAAHDGRGAATLLHEKVLELYQTSTLIDAIPFIYQASNEQRSKIASLAPSVLELANSGDQASLRIVSEMVEIQADFLSCVHDKLNRATETVALWGGLYRDPLAPTLMVTPLRNHPKIAERELDIRYLSDYLNGSDSLKAALITFLSSATHREDSLKETKINNDS